MDVTHQTYEELVQRANDLEAALNTRDVIGQAKGILMERHGLDADEAFQRLVDPSQNTNSRLSDIAAVIALGTTPTRPRSDPSAFRVIPAATDR